MSGPDETTGFAGMPRRGMDAIGGAVAAILGVRDASPYEANKPSHCANAPAAIRKAAEAFGLQLGQLDFDVGGPFLRARGEEPNIVDLGDLPTDPADPAGNRARIEAGVRRVLDSGAVPVLLGGDDSVPVPAFRAFAGRAPLTVLQVDAHVDWGDAIRGNPYGYGSTMRRAAEVDAVRGMLQVGIRGLGSGTADQIEDAKAWGTRLVTMGEWRRGGVAPLLEHLPAGGDVLVTIDCDGLDPAVLPGVNMPTPGGLSYDDVLELLQGAATRGRIVGCFLVELVPERDPTGLSALVAARIVASALGLIRQQAARR